MPGRRRNPVGPAVVAAYQQRKGIGSGLAIGLGVIAAGILAIVLLRKPKRPETKFRNLEATYDGSQAGSSIPKVLGEALTVVVRFGYMGAPGEFDVGVGLSPTVGPLGSLGPVTHWFAQRIKLAASTDWKGTEVTIKEAIPSGLTSGKKDALKFIQVAGGDRDPRGEGYLLANWDRNVYDIQGVVVVRDLEVAYAR